MTVLVTGGAGYIGSHVVDELRATGEDVVVLDDLSDGDVRRIGATAFERLDLAAPDSEVALGAVLRRRRIDSVVHLAAKKRVDESVARPLHYWRQNLGGLGVLLAAMRTEGVQHLVFSSSAAVYGDVRTATVAEDAPTAPVNPYGRTKLAGEWIVRDSAAAGSPAATSLRYFNVAGAARVELADTAVTNLIPITVSRMLAGRRPIVLGTDYDTVDGTCVRDYVHVADIARAHLVALDAVRRGDAAAHYNVGSGSGYSVRQVVHEAARQLDVPAATEDRPRRSGDPAAVVADATRAQRQLGWTARHGLDEIVRSTIAGLRHPSGGGAAR